MGCEKPGRIDDEVVWPETAYFQFIQENYNVSLASSHAHERHGEPRGTEYPASRFDNPSAADYLGEGKVASQFHQSWENTARAMFLSAFQSEMTEWASTQTAPFSATLEINTGDPIGWAVRGDPNPTEVYGITHVTFVYVFNRTTQLWHEITGYPNAHSVTADKTVNWGR